MKFLNDGCKLNLKNLKGRLFLFFLLFVVVVFWLANFMIKTVVDFRFDIRVMSLDTQNVWAESTELEIFNSNRSDGVFNKLIYPGVSGEYHFTISNETNRDVNYVITGYDESNVSFNMEYMLIKEEDLIYIIDDWKPISDVQISDNILNGDNCDYVLKWRWNDSFVFGLDGGYYTLHIVVSYDKE